MPILFPQVCRMMFAACSCLSLLVPHVALAGQITTEPGQKRAASPLLELQLPVISAPDQSELGTASGMSALGAVRHGRWASACSIATKVLAYKVADVDALGVFSLCSAIVNDLAAASTALEQLHIAERAPYYGLLTEGVLYLRDGLPEKSENNFKAVLKSKSGNPLALYFMGEALHAQHRVAEAMVAFRSVLKEWPDHAPALTAVARLLTPPKASKANLAEALALAERATGIDPANQAHWKLLAGLCERAGQTGRANAIALQWLAGPPRIKQ